jgi:glycosyltransferase involved in cell wall biosynthesis
VKKLCVIQPILSNYTRQTLLEMAAYCDVDIVFSATPSGKGFGASLESPDSRVRYFVVPTLRPLGNRAGMIQRGLAKHIFKTRPDAIIISADPRYLSFWTTLVVAKLLGIPAHAHGHGIYRKTRISMLYRLMMTALLRLSTTYICYAPIVRDSFVQHGFDAHKLRVAHNSLTNVCTVKPEDKDGDETGVLFVGRLREDSNVEMLFRVVRRLHDDGVPLSLHVIGSGERESQLKSEARGSSSVVFHGEIYDPERVREISRHCGLGCYPGNAGLSVIHLMSLSLPVVTHDNMRTQGPEPSFIRDGENGILFDHCNPAESLYQAIKRLALDRRGLAAMQRESYATFEELVNPPLAERLWSIVNASLDEINHRSLRKQGWTAKPSSVGSQPKTGKS